MDVGGDYVEGKKNLTQRRGSDLDKEEVDSMITTIYIATYQKGKPLKIVGENAIWQRS